MRPLYLIRHASPNIRPDTPAREWTLSERGVGEAQTLALTAAAWGLEAIYSSSEPKARATGLIIGDALGLPVHVVDAFDELRLPEWIGNSDAFNDVVRAVLEGDTPPGATLTPRVDARNAETAADAARRFGAGVGIVAQGPAPAAVVSHGRIITAYLSQTGRIEEPFEFWRSIPMPGWACIDLDGKGMASAFSA